MEQLNLKAGKVKGVSGDTMKAIDCMFDSRSGFHYQPIGDSWEDNGVVILRPADIIESDKDSEENKLEVIARLLGEDIQVLSKLDYLEVWDDR